MYNIYFQANKLRFIQILVINEAMFVTGNKFTAVLLKHPYFPQVGEVNGKPHTV